MHLQVSGFFLRVPNQWLIIHKGAWAASPGHLQTYSEKYTNKNKVSAANCPGWFCLTLSELQRTWFISDHVLKRRISGDRSLKAPCAQGHMFKLEHAAAWERLQQRMGGGGCSCHTQSALALPSADKNAFGKAEISGVNICMSGSAEKWDINIGSRTSWGDTREDSWLSASPPIS